MTRLFEGRNRLTRAELENLGLLFPVSKKDLKVMPADPPFDHVYPRPSHGKKIHRFSGTQWWQECGRKKAHITLEAAIDAARAMPRKVGYMNDHYSCRWCDWFHVAHVWDGGPVKI